MNAPIRTVDELCAGIRDAQIERELSDERFEDIAGLPKGSVAKYLGPKKVKGLGQISLPLMLGGLGKALVIVDDPEQIERVEGRWIKRKIVGGSAVQLKAMTPQLASAASMADKMRALGQLTPREARVKGGKRRMMSMSKRDRQRQASHAARARWAKAKEAANYKDGKGSERKRVKDLAKSAQIVIE